MLLEFSDEKVVATILKKEITESDIKNILADALEGGSNYWVGVDIYYKGRKDRPEEQDGLSISELDDKYRGIPISQWATKLILEGKSVKFFDVKGEDYDEDWVLTLSKLLEGIRLNARNRPYDCDLENCNENTADCILQYALLGDIIYG